MKNLGKYKQEEIKKAIYEIGIESLCGVSHFTKNENVYEYLEMMEMCEIMEIEEVIHKELYGKALNAIKQKRKVHYYE